MKTAECVAPGHPDKVCDQIADAILDEYLKQDKNSRVAVEVAGGHGKLFITGEVTSRASVDTKEIACAVYKEIGYHNDLEIIENVVRQSLEIKDGGAGDQGIMIGYACNENNEMVPQEFYLARKILQNLPENFGPDAKSQVTLDKDKEIVKLIIPTSTSIWGVVPRAHNYGKLYGYAQSFCKKYETNVFETFGFEADAGMTGRKIVADAYGPNIPVGGGAFSGKDPTKVDRSGAYMARKIAVDFINKGAEEALVKIAYAIGKSEPVMAEALVDNKIYALKKWDLRPQAIIEQLDLLKPIYRETSKWGHFGNGFLWDK